MSLPELNPVFEWRETASDSEGLVTNLGPIGLGISYDNGWYTEYFGERKRATIQSKDGAKKEVIERFIQQAYSLL